MRLDGVWGWEVEVRVWGWEVGVGGRIKAKRSGNPVRVLGRVMVGGAKKELV